MTLYVFSDTINSFLRRIRAELFSILRSEVGAETEDDVFRLPGLRGRLSVVLFEDSRKIGYFNPPKMEIGVHRKVMFIQDRETVKNILRHEIAHMIVHLFYGEDTATHGPVFRNYCALLGWGDSVSKASMELGEEDLEGHSAANDADKILAKVKKLLALSSSDNPHEAYTATLMANRLLIRHNLSILKQTGFDGGKEVFMKRVLEVKRFSAKHHAISDILSSFLVSPVLSHGRGLSYLEVTGERTNVEIADYVAAFLDRRLEELWKAARKNLPGAGGHVGRNSFMRGVAAGYREKVEAASKDYTKDEGFALVHMETRLEEFLGLVYGRLTTARTRGFFCSESFGAGREEGKRLSIVRGITEPSNVRLLIKD